MQEVVKKINELYSLLETKLKSTDVLNRQLAEQKKTLELLEEKSNAKLNKVSAMERIYQKYKNFAEEVDKFTSMKKDYATEMKNAEVKIKESEAIISKLEKERKELKEQKDTLSRQTISLKEREASFDKKKEELKGLINGSAVKDMLK